MKKLEKYGYWLMLSDYDLGTAECLIQCKRWVYVAYLCQQAAERTLKGMYVYYTDSEAPKTHNVNFLFNRITSCKEFQDEADLARFDEGSQSCEDFLVDAMFYYMSDYPFSYKNIKSRFVDEALAVELYERAKENIAWLRSFQPEVEIPDSDTIND